MIIVTTPQNGKSEVWFAANENEFYNAIDAANANDKIIYHATTAQELYDNFADEDETTFQEFIEELGLPVGISPDTVLYRADYIEVTDNNSMYHLADPSKLAAYTAAIREDSLFTVVCIGKEEAEAALNHLKAIGRLDDAKKLEKLMLLED